MIRRILYALLILFTLFNLYLSIAKADSINAIAADLRAESTVPFRYGVAQDLALNIYDAQLTAPYAGAASLELSVDSVLRAISIDGTLYVGFANVDPITWLQSTIAIDPGASIGIGPSALYFGDVVVSTPEPATWVMLLIGLAIVGIFVWSLRKPKPTTAPPIIMTGYGPVSENPRQVAVANMQASPFLRGRVFQLIVAEYGGNEAQAAAEFYRRYQIHPELGEPM